MELFLILTMMPGYNRFFILKKSVAFQLRFMIYSDLVNDRPNRENPTVKQTSIVAYTVKQAHMNSGDVIGETSLDFFL